MNQTSSQLTKEQLLTLLTQKTAWNSWRETCNRDVVDLQGVDISNRDLSGYDLRRIDLTGCTARNTCFAHADLYLATLTQGSYISADFSHSIMINVVADRADFSGSDFTSVLAHGLYAVGSSFTSCKMMHANLMNLKASHGQFDGALLTSTELDGSDLSFANLINATFDGANMNQVELHRAKILPEQLVSTANWYYIKSSLELVSRVFQLIRRKIIDTHIPNLPNP